MSEITLLIADDEASIRKGLAGVIDWGARGIRLIGEAATGDEAYEILCAHRPDIVITDIRMPGLSGLELIEKAREEGLDTHFIILSGYDDFQYAQRAIRSQVASYLLKPVKTVDLTREVDAARDRILERRNQGRMQQQTEFEVQRALGLRSERFYHMLAEGEYHSEAEIWAAVGSIGFTPMSCPIVAVVFRFTLPAAAEPRKFGKEDGRLFKAALRNVVAELAQPDEVVFFTEQGNNLGLLMPARKDLLGFLQHCIDTMRRISSLQLSAGVGALAQSLLDVEMSCQQAFEAVEYHMYGGKGGVFDHAALAKDPGASPAQPPSMQRLAEAVVAGDGAQVRAELEGFLQHLFYVPQPAPRYVRGMCAYVVYEVDKWIPKLMRDAAPLPVAHWQGELAALGTFVEIKEYLMALFLGLAEELQGQKKGHLPGVIEQAKRYIETHVYTRIKVEAIAAEVHLSESHFAALFKRYTGVTVRDYIVSTKLDKAKELLRAGEVTVFEIAEKLDYADYRSFSRAFKKYAGMSPTEYRSGISDAHQGVQ